MGGGGTRESELLTKGIFVRSVKPKGKIQRDKLIHKQKKHQLLLFLIQQTNKQKNQPPLHRHLKSSSILKASICFLIHLSAGDQLRAQQGAGLGSSVRLTLLYKMLNNE